MGAIADFFYGLRWQDYVDVLILTGIFYYLILMVQGTRTSQMLVGFSFLALLYLFSQQGELRGVAWLLDNLFNSIIIVILVLFQTDIRRALTTIGTRKLFRDKSAEFTSKLLGKICKACQYFSESKIGVLIVLEKDIRLMGHTSSGVPLDAKVSVQLLMAIFNTRAPLHDGAIIIDHSGRIQSAGNIIPLTTRIDATKNLGTRHRAALALSDESDAVIVVVSEETGKISLVHQGKIEEQRSIYDLQKELEELLPHISQL